MGTSEGAPRSLGSQPESDTSSSTAPGHRDFFVWSPPGSPLQAGGGAGLEAWFGQHGPA